MHTSLRKLCAYIQEYTFYTGVHTLYTGVCSLYMGVRALYTGVHTLYIGVHTIEAYTLHMHMHTPLPQTSRFYILEHMPH